MDAKVTVKLRLEQLKNRLQSQIKIEQNMKSIASLSKNNFFFSQKKLFVAATQNRLNRFQSPWRQQ